MDNIRFLMLERIVSIQQLKQDMRTAVIIKLVFISVNYTACTSFYSVLIAINH